MSRRPMAHSRLRSILSVLVAVEKAERPMSSQEVEEATGLCSMAVCHAMAALRRVGHVAPVAWTRESGRGVYSPMWRGSGADPEPYPGAIEPRWWRAEVGDEGGKYNEAACRLVSARKAGPVDVHSLRAQTGLCAMAVRGALGFLHEAGVCAIARWARRSGVGGSATAEWSWGISEHAPSLARLSNAEVCRRYAEKVRGGALTPRGQAAEARRAETAQKKKAEKAAADARMEEARAEAAAKREAARAQLAANRLAEKDRRRAEAEEAILRRRLDALVGPGHGPSAVVQVRPGVRRVLADVRYAIQQAPAMVVPAGIPRSVWDLGGVAA